MGVGAGRDPRGPTAGLSRLRVPHQGAQGMWEPEKADGPRASHPGGSCCLYSGPGLLGDTPRPRPSSLPATAGAQPLLECTGLRPSPLRPPGRLPCPPPSSDAASAEASARGEVRPMPFLVRHCTGVPQSPHHCLCAAASTATRPRARSKQGPGWFPGQSPGLARGGIQPRAVMRGTTVCRSSCSRAWPSASQPLGTGGLTDWLTDGRKKGVTAWVPFWHSPQGHESLSQCPQRGCPLGTCTPSPTNMPTAARGCCHPVDSPRPPRRSPTLPLCSWVWIHRP